MGNIGDFLLKYWIIILIVIVLVILAIIGYFIEKHSLKQNTKKQITNDLKMTFENSQPLVQMQTYSQNQEDNNILYQNVNKKMSHNDDTSISEFVEQKNKFQNEQLKQKIKDSIDIIIYNKEKRNDEFDEIIFKKKLVDDLKNNFNDIEMKIEPIKDPKIKQKIYTDIELPEINLNTGEEDIWR